MESGNAILRLLKHSEEEKDKDPHKIMVYAKKRSIEDEAKDKLLGRIARKFA